LGIDEKSFVSVSGSDRLTLLIMFARDFQIDYEPKDMQGARSKRERALIVLAFAGEKRYISLLVIQVRLYEVSRSSRVFFQKTAAYKGPPP
jgi:hypothetical protein